MALATKIILYLTLIAFFFGQLIRPTIFGVTLPLFDIFIVLLAIANFFNQNTKKNNHYILIFIFIAIISWLINPLKLSNSLTSIFYLLRIISLLSFFVYPLNIDKNSEKFFHIILFTFTFFGLLQYFFYPDLTSFNSLNWDPHLYRLVGTLLDPTFTALILLLFLIKLYFSSSNYLYLIFVYISLSLTYSRSSLLAFFIVFSYISIKTKKITLFLSTTLLIILTVILLPRMPGEGTKLERTSSIKAKIVNYQQGVNLWQQSPLIGLGYNRLPELNTSSHSHSKSGFDGSLLTIAVCTGLVGLVFFILSFTNSLKNSSLYWQSLLLTVFVHSLFANSLLYPWILFYLALEFKYQKLSPPVS